MDKLASDRIYCDVATADRYLRINIGNTTRRNIIGSYVRILCGNIWKILCWCKKHRKKNMWKPQQKFERQGYGTKTLIDITYRNSGTIHMEGNIHFAICKIQNQRGFTGRIKKTDTLDSFNVKNVIDRIHDVLCFTFLQISGNNEIYYNPRRQITNKNERWRREKKNKKKE